MLDVNYFDELRIGLATGDQIRAWSNGEVKKPETINYRTLKPEKDGLFCERIFGPTRDWECHCGKYKRVRFKGIICERCGVEITRAKVRRERMGHIELAAPVTHIWYFKGVPSRLGYLLDLAPKDLEKVIYFAAYMITSVDEEARHRDLASLEGQIDVERKNLEKRRDSDVEERAKKLEANLAELEAEGAKGDVRRKVKESAEREMSEIRKRSDAEIDRLNAVWDRFQTLKVQDLEGDEMLYREMRDRFGLYFSGGMGAQAIKERLESFDLEGEALKLREIIRSGKGQKRARAIKRLKVATCFLATTNSPQGMVLDCVPVIPPDLRPMVQLDGGRFATSDLNDLYRRVINRNNRLKRLLDLQAPEIIVNNEKRMLQEAVDALFDNGRRGRPVTGPGNRALKSLSDMLKGKQGRFRQNLLGKRVDYSGRSVIVAGPSLRLHQCGLPKLMALELFKPFIMARLVERKAVQNIKAAKKMVDSMIPEVWDVLEEVIHEHPVLLNRAPTLHRLGIQAFEPKLVEGKAIQVHPLVCHAFNADFDGDQMAVHLPLSAEAQAEARILMLSSNNVLSPAHGKPLATPSQDMVIGGYYLTYCGEDLDGKTAEELDPRPKRFQSEEEIFLALESDQVNLQEPVEYRKDGELLLTTPGRVIFNEEVSRSLADALGEDYDPSKLEYINRALGKKEMGDFVTSLVDDYGAVAIAHLLDTIKELGFRYATQAGITISKNDIVIPESKEQILEEYEERVGRIETQFERGLITDEERHESIVNLWTEATDTVADAMEQTLFATNPVVMMANSGARGSFKQVRQLAGMRGLMANPKGDILERPIKANFMEGLSVLEYFISPHGARKGLADTALRTADSGYLTRRLVDVSQDVIVREEDCGTKEHIELRLILDGEPNKSVAGRAAADDVHKPIKDGKPGKTVLVEKGEEITMNKLRRLVAEFGEYAEEATIPVRSVLKCRSEYGLCRVCYGTFLATGGLSEIGDAVGIIAAQSIGEPGTQLTMRTFHTGGVAGSDITHGLPRVVEIFEARNPKGAAVLADVSGKVDIDDSDRTIKVTVTPTGLDDKGELPDPKEYSFPRRTRLRVTKGELVESGDALSEGSINPADLLLLKGATTTELYLVGEVQKVYKSQGVEIHDKHIELIVRQMLKKVRVDTNGDTELLPGQLVDRVQLEHENARVKKGKGEQATYEPIILGITKASLATESFLSAASFQETTKVLTDAAIEGKTDRLLGLKENVIIGKLIPAATGLKRYRQIAIEPTEPLPVTFQHPEAEAELLAALEEIGEGDGFDLDALGLQLDEAAVEGDGEPADL